MSELEGFSEFNFTAENATRPVYDQGVGPAVVILHELPGMIPECVELARRICNQGFTVFLPLLFGQPNQPLSIPQTLAFAVQICISKEFYCFAKGESSPITNWLRALCREAKQRCNGKGVGVIGMCLTGGFVFSLMADDAVLAPVASQPSLPFPVRTKHKQALGISHQELAQIKAKLTPGVNLLALRFSEDGTCPRERFVRLRQEFGDQVETIEIDSSPGNPHQISSMAHAVLTVHFVDNPEHPTHQALTRILAFLDEKLT
ncbi:MAG: dienelactone hydrolase family protein [Lyngbya sp.]|nr:dienelactone hydrolase family protein [Lyngbya sp.]